MVKQYRSPMTAQTRTVQANSGALEATLGDADKSGKFSELEGACGSMWKERTLCRRNAKSLVVVFASSQGERRQLVGAKQKKAARCGSNEVNVDQSGLEQGLSGKTIQFETIHGSFPLTNPYGDHQR